MEDAFTTVNLESNYMDNFSNQTQTTFTLNYNLASSINTFNQFLFKFMDSTKKNSALYKSTNSVIDLVISQDALVIIGADETVFSINFEKREQIKINQNGLLSFSLNYNKFKEWALDYISTNIAWERHYNNFQMNISSTDDKKGILSLKYNKINLDVNEDIKTSVYSSKKFDIQVKEVKPYLFLLFDDFRYDEYKLDDQSYIQLNDTKRNLSTIIQKHLEEKSRTLLFFFETQNLIKITNERNNIETNYPLTVFHRGSLDKGALFDKYMNVESPVIVLDANLLSSYYKNVSAFFDFEEQNEAKMENEDKSLKDCLFYFVLKDRFVFILYKLRNSYGEAIGYVLKNMGEIVIHDDICPNTLKIRKGLRVKRRPGLVKREKAKF